MTQALSLEPILLFTRDKMRLLLQALNSETTVLKNNNISALEKITLEKNILTEQIEKNEQQRVHFLNSTSLNPNEPSQWLISSKLKSIWDEIKQLSEAAQKQNQINGQVINGNHRRIKTQIEILTTSSPSVELTYSSSGENINQHQSNTLAHA